jgi:sugar phosphate isomerase/epimerase
MQLGISTYSFPWSIGVGSFLPSHPLTSTELLQYASQKDLSFVQFGDNYPLHCLEDYELNELKYKADHLKIKVQVGTRKLTVENVINYISIARILETDFIRIVIDDEDYHPPVNQVIGIINQLLPYLHQSNLRLAIENHDRFPALTLKHIVESTDNDRVAICLDTANSLGAGEGLGEVISVLAPYTFNLHIKDFTVKRMPHKMGFKISGCIAGSGILNIPSVIEQIRKYGRCYSAILELWSDPAPSIEETIQKEKESVEKSIDYMKKLMS